MYCAFRDTALRRYYERVFSTDLASETIRLLLEIDACMMVLTPVLDSSGAVVDISTSFLSQRGAHTLALGPLFFAAKSWKDLLPSDVFEPLRAYSDRLLKKAADSEHTERVPTLDLGMLKTEFKEQTLTVTVLRSGRLLLSWDDRSDHVTALVFMTENIGLYTIRHVNNTAAEVLKMPPERLVGQPALPVFDSASISLAWHTFRGVLRTGAPLVSRVSSLDVFGSLRSYDQSVHSVGGGLLLTFTLVAEEALSATSFAENVLSRNQTLSTVLAHTPTIVLRHELNISKPERPGLVTWCNEAYLAVAGLSSLEDAIGRPTRELMRRTAQGDAARSDDAYSHMLDALLANGVSQYVDRFTAANGSTRWMQWTSHVLNVHGEVVTVQSVGVDVTNIQGAYEAVAEVAAQMHDALALERSQIAVRLHDSVTQTVLAASWESQKLDQSPGSERVIALLESALEELRSCLVDLSEPASGDLLELLRPELEDLEKAGVTTHTERLLRSPTKLEVVFLRIARESLRNVLRHAAAANVWVSSSSTDGSMRLEIEDDGIGFKELAVQRAARDGHVGVASSRQIAAAAGGSYELLHRSPTGTRVVVTLPYEDEPRELLL